MGERSFLGGRTWHLRRMARAIAQDEKREVLQTTTPGRGEVYQTQQSFNFAFGKKQKMESLVAPAEGRGGGKQKSTR